MAENRLDSVLAAVLTDKTPDAPDEAPRDDGVKPLPPDGCALPREELYGNVLESDLPKTGDAEKMQGYVERAENAAERAENAVEAVLNDYDFELREDGHLWVTLSREEGSS